MSHRPEVDRAERAGRNQALFRQVNERLEELATTFQAVSHSVVFACECADLTCIEQVEMSLDEYEAVRREPDEFFVRPGHVYPDVERVVRDTERYAVVAKIAEAAEAAERHSPAATS